MEIQHSGNSERQLQSLFPGQSAEKVALAAGAIPGSKVEFRSVIPGVLGVNVVHPHYTATQLFEKFGKGTNSVIGVHNCSQRAEPELRGEGYRRFKDTIGHLRDLGVGSIYVGTAAGGPGQEDNGFYTWPRFGFQGQIDPDAVKKMPKELQDDLAGDHTFHKLFSLPGGADYWKENGYEHSNLLFDLHPESPHSKAFDAYHRKREEQTASGVRPDYARTAPTGTPQPAPNSGTAATGQGNLSAAGMDRLARVLGSMLRKKNSRVDRALKFAANPLAQFYNEQLNAVADRLHQKHGVADIDSFKQRDHYSDVVKGVRGDHDLAADTLNDMLYGDRSLEAIHKPGYRLGAYVGIKIKQNPQAIEKSKESKRKTKIVELPLDERGKTFDPTDYRDPESDPMPFDIPEQWEQEASSSQPHAVVANKIGLTEDKVVLLRKLLARRESRRLRKERGRPLTATEKRRNWEQNTRQKSDESLNGKLLNYLKDRPQGTKIMDLPNRLGLPIERIKSLMKSVGAKVQLVSKTRSGVGMPGLLVYHPDHEVPESEYMKHLNDIYEQRQRGVKLKDIGASYGVSATAVINKLKSRESALKRLAEFNTKSEKQSRQEFPVKFSRPVVKRPIHELIRGTRLATVIKVMHNQGTPETRGFTKKILNQGDLNALGVLHDHLDDGNDPAAAEIMGQYNLRGAARKLLIDQVVHPTIDRIIDENDIDHKDAQRTFVGGHAARHMKFLSQFADPLNLPAIHAINNPEIHQSALAAKEAVPDVTAEELRGSLLRHQLNAVDRQHRNRFVTAPDTVVDSPLTQRIHDRIYREDNNQVNAAALEGGHWTQGRNGKHDHRDESRAAVAAAQFKFAKEWRTNHKAFWLSPKGEVHLVGDDQLHAQWMFDNHGLDENQAHKFGWHRGVVDFSGETPTVTTTGYRPLNSKQTDAVTLHGIKNGAYEGLSEVISPGGSERTVRSIKFAKGKNPEGGLTVAEARRQGIRAGSETKAAAEKAGGFSKIKGKTQKRRKSFCSRMCGTAKMHPKAAKDSDSRLKKSLRIWGCRCKNSREGDVVKFSDETEDPEISQQLKGAEEKYPKITIGKKLSDLKVLSDVPNTDSIDATFYPNEHTVLSGVRSIPVEAFVGLSDKHPTVDGEKRVVKLVDAIKRNKKIKPLIVVSDSQDRRGEGPYVLEGSHRIRALKRLGVTHIPAVVVVHHLEPSNNSQKFFRYDMPFVLPDEPVHFSRQPNPVRGNFLQALKRVQSRQQDQLRKLAEELYEKMNLTPVTVRDAIHSNGPTASANTAHAIYHDSDPELAKAAAAQYGLASQSPALLLFHVGDDGPDALHKVSITGSGEGVLKRLDKHGLLQRTLIPHKTGYDVFLADRGAQLADKVKQFATEMGSSVNSVRGVGELIGGGNDSTADSGTRSSYRSIIQAYQSKQNGPNQVQQGSAPSSQVQS